MQGWWQYFYFKLKSFFNSQWNQGSRAKSALDTSMMSLFHQSGNTSLSSLFTKPSWALPLHSGNEAEVFLRWTVPRLDSRLQSRGVGQCRRSSQCVLRSDHAASRSEVLTWWTDLSHTPVIIALLLRMWALDWNQTTILYISLNELINVFIWFIATKHLPSVTGIAFDLNEESFGCGGTGASDSPTCFWLNQNSGLISCHYSHWQACTAHQLIVKYRDPHPHIGHFGSLSHCVFNDKMMRHVVIMCYILLKMSEWCHKM